MAMLFSAITLLPVTKPSHRTAHQYLFSGQRKYNNKNSRNTTSFSLCFSLKAEIQTQSTVTNLKKSPKRGPRIPFLSQGRDEDETSGVVCPGCGIFMQDNDPNLPGFFQKKKIVHEEIEDEEEEDLGLGLPLVDELEDGFESNFDEDEETVEKDDDEAEDELEDGFESNFDEDEEEDEVDADEDEDKVKDEDKDEDGDFDWDSEDWEGLEDDEDESRKKELDGFGPATVGYGNITEAIIEKRKWKKVSKAEKKKKLREEAKKVVEDSVTVCARCHSLRNYGQVKNQKAENLIPDFDFDRLVTTRLMKPTGKSDASVVVMVVDCVDFDGSFPKRAAKSLFKALDASNKDRKLKLPRLVLVATKVDLLPSQISPTRLDKWVRNRARANGAPKLSGVYLVSARKDLGVRNLLSFIKELAGPRGNVWVIGAQNAGKSTLINAFSKKEGKKITKLTEAAVPGTTLGILRIGGILPAKAKMYDTPGLLHPYLMSVRLDQDEQKMMEIRKELQPRTYRIKAGQSVHIGALMRLDLNQATIETIYVTVCASPNISLHMGKTETADELWEKHAGIRLQPPIGVERVSELGKWEKRELKVSGVSWDVNSIDIAAAGLGWFSLGLKGEANLTLWAFEGVEITLRDPLVQDRAPFLERPGFLLPKAISEALGSQSKLEAEKRKKLEDASDMMF